MSARGDVTITVGPETVDWRELYGLVCSAFDYMDARIDPPSSLHRMGVDDFKTKAQAETLIIATADEGLAGCLFCRPAAGWLYVGKMAVDPDVQGAGIGRALMAAAFDLAKRGRYLGLELETRIELVENHRAFERLGFSKVAETSHAGYDRPTGITMRAELPG